MRNLSYIFLLFFLLSSHFVFCQGEIKTVSLQETPLTELHIQYMYNYGLNMIMYQKPEYSKHSGFWSLVEKPDEQDGRSASFFPRKNSTVYISGSLIEWGSNHIIHKSVPGEEPFMEIASVVDILRKASWNTQIPVKLLSDSLETVLLDKHTHVETIYEKEKAMHSWVSFSGLYQKGDYYYIEVLWRYPSQQCINCPVLAMFPRRSYFVFRYCPLERLVIPVFMTSNVFDSDLFTGDGDKRLGFKELSSDYFCKED